MNSVIVAEVTSTVRKLNTEVLLTERDGMPKQCVVNLDHIQSVSQDRLGELITTLEDEKMDEIVIALLFAIGGRRFLF